VLKKMFLEAMSRAATTVSVVTTDGPAGLKGATVSAMTSVCVDPGAPALLVCMHHLGQAAKAICKNKVFCVNILRDQQRRMADRFAGRLNSEAVDRFADESWRRLATGAPAATDALASFDCKLTEVVRCGSHWIFIGEVVEVVLSEHEAPLVYANRDYRRLRNETNNGPPAGALATSGQGGRYEQ
jgi:flavin reductase (DIM6/NTAB) family NADH-FMN oxidoreductase RutF